MVQYDMDSELNTRTWTARLVENEAVAEIHEPPNQLEDTNEGDGPSQQPTTVSMKEDASEPVDVAASETSQEKMSQPVATGSSQEVPTSSSPTGTRKD